MTCRDAKSAIALVAVVVGLIANSPPARAQPASNATYARIKAYLDAVPAIDTHDHLWPFDKLPGYVTTENGKGMNLAGLWHNSYLRRVKPLTPWTPGGKFTDWWAKAKHDFDDVRAVSFYRYQAVAFKDLYGVDFDRITDDQAADLDRRIFRNYLSKDWLYEVVTQRANIELMFNDPYWARFDFRTDYPFGVLVLNVTTLTRGFHPSEFADKDDDPYAFAKTHGLPADLAGRLPRGPRPAVRRGEGEGGGLPEDDAGVPAGAGLRPGAGRAGGEGVRPAAVAARPGGGEGVRGLRHVAAGRAERAGTTCRSRSTPGTPASRGPTRCSWWT